MNPQKTKIFLKSIIIGAVLIGLLAISYFVFKKDTPDDTLPSVVAAVDSSVSTNIIGATATRSVGELNELKSAIATVTTIFSSPAFKGLEHFPFSVPPEPVGRKNPFAMTEWKIKIQALEAASKTPAI